MGAMQKAHDMPGLLSVGLGMGSWGEARLRIGASGSSAFPKGQAFRWEVASQFGGSLLVWGRGWCGGKEPIPQHACMHAPCMQDMHACMHSNAYAASLHA